MAKRVPKTRSRKKAPTLPGFTANESPMHVWVNRNTCVVRDGEWRRIVFHGTQAAAWRVGQTAIRNALLVQMANEPHVVLEDLARAFELSSEAVRLIRRKAESEGLLAVMLPTPRDTGAIAPEVVERMEKLFEQGKTGAEIIKALGGRVSQGTVSKYRRRWKARKPQAAEPEPQQQSLTLPTITVAAAPVASERPVPTELELAPEAGEIRKPREESEYRSRESAPGTAEAERVGAKRQLEERLPRSRRGVQHAGVWLLTAMAGSLGLFESAAKLQPADGSPQPLRLALDAVLAALGIGEGCVEGVRRLATSSGASLLLASAMPSATWVRRRLGAVAGQAEQFHGDLSRRLFEAARNEAEPDRPVVFYVDNHTREFTGEPQLTRHWKMQKDRTVPGTTDYWIHDSHGRPITALAAPQQGSMVQYLPRCARVIRAALGKESRALVAFDRGGAFPTAMAELKGLTEGPVDFLTYERAPFPLHGREYFERHGQAVELGDEEDKPQRVLVLDGGTYLGEGRGRVRRLSLLLPDDAQINLLTSSTEDAVWLARTLFARWGQENAFKYGKERWGFDQLDSRQVEAYPDGTIIPNPCRRNLERSRDRAVQREGKLRCKLARTRADAPERAELKAKVAETMSVLADVRAALRQTPQHIAIEETRLAGKLVHHRREYKLLVDTVRVAAMAAEDRLSARLRPYLATEAESKQVLQNAFKAVGNIQVANSHITIALDPSGNRAELRAIRKLFDEINHEAISHPADPLHRPLRFRLQAVVSSQGA